MAGVILKISSKLMIFVRLKVSREDGQMTILGKLEKLYMKFINSIKNLMEVKCVIFFINNYAFTHHSTGPSLGNLVDGLPGALHYTKAL